ncbi:MAG: response regulator [Desulfobulbaceae bacterium]|nr:response regulator [Desulfobulbaceae bacterium]
MHDPTTTSERQPGLNRFRLLSASWFVGCVTIFYFWISPDSQAFYPAIAICLSACIILSVLYSSSARQLQKLLESELNLRQQRNELEKNLVTQTNSLSETNKQLRNDLNESKNNSDANRRELQKLKNIFNNLPDAICVIDNEYSVTYANPALSDLIESDPENLIGSKCFDAWKTPYCGKDNCPLKRIDRGEKNIIAECLWQKDANENSSPLSITVNPFIDENGVQCGIIKTARQSLANNEQQKAISRRWAHDLNNILAVVIGHTELATQQAEPATQIVDNLEKAMQAAKRGQNLITQILHPVKNITPTPICTRKNAWQSIPGGHEKILFVDDEETLVLMTKQFLEELGYQFDGETSSTNALERFKKNPEYYDLIITDQTMPQLSGSKMAEVMLQTRPDLPIIICSGYIEEIDKEHAKTIGIKKFLHKPVPAPNLAQAVRSLLDKDSH